MRVQSGATNAQGILGIMLDLILANPSSPFQQLVEHLKEANWQVEQDAEAQIVHTGFAGEHCQFRCAAAIVERPAVIQFITIFPMTIPQEKLALVSEFCARANWEMMLGRFELGYTERQLRFQTAAPFSNGALDSETLRTVIAVNIFVVEEYFRGVTSVLYGDASPAEAVRRAEAGQNAHQDQETPFESSDSP